MVQKYYEHVHTYHSPPPGYSAKDPEVERFQNISTLCL